MAPLRLFGTPQNVLEVPERKPLLCVQPGFRGRGMGRALPTAVRPTPLVSWKNIWQIFIGRPRIDSKLAIVLGFLFHIILLVAGTVCPCVTITRKGNQEYQTLVYKSVYKCTGNTSVCRFNNIEYTVCRSGSQTPVCYDPQEDPERIWVEIHAKNNAKMKLVARAERKGDHPITFIFDACTAISHGPWFITKCGGMEWVKYYKTQHKYMGFSGKCKSGRQLFVEGWNCVVWATWATTDKTAMLEKIPVKPDCTWGTCNLVNFTILQPEKWDKKDRWGKSMWDETFSILIEGKGSDPGVALRIIQSREYRIGEDLRRYQTFWRELETDPWEQSLTPRTKNLFVELAQTIAATMNVSNCYICGGTLKGDQWPWEVIEWNHIVPYNLSGLSKHTIRTRWELSNNLIGTFCIQRNPDKIDHPLKLGDSNCRNVRIINGAQLTTWGNVSINPWVNLTEETATLWYNGSLIGDGHAPAGLYWICGKTAYSHLVPDWTGTCFLGHLNPYFFMIPLERGVDLGHVESPNRRKRGLKIGQWKDDEWPPERIIAYYDPASWAQDGSYGYRTPIYMLNRIIRLQAVVELLTRENEQALLLLAKQNTQIRNAIYQNRLALDYLLASEGGVCGKFNLTNCCLEIGDTQEAIAEITGHMRNMAHVPIQKWTGIMDDAGWLGGIFNNWKQALFFLCMILFGLMMLPCIIPIVKSMINSAVKAAMPKTQMTIREPEIRYKIIPAQEDLEL